MLKSIPRCINLKFPGALSQLKHIHVCYNYDLNWVGLIREIQVQNCIVGLLSTCLILTELTVVLFCSMIDLILSTSSVFPSRVCRSLLADSLANLSFNLRSSSNVLFCETSLSKRASLWSKSEDYHISEQWIQRFFGKYTRIFYLHQSLLEVRPDLSVGGLRSPVCNIIL